MSNTNPPAYSSLRSPQRKPLAEQLPLPAPLSIFIEPTNVCNFRCRQCPESLSDYKEQAGYYAGMPYELFEKIARDIRELGRLKALKLYFLGEPLVNKRLPDMIKLARELDLADRIEVTSNGSLLTEANARALIDSGLDYLRISIYSLDQARHEHLTQARVSVDQIRENLIRFQKIKRELGASKPFLYVKMINPFTGEADQFMETYGDIADEVALELPMNWDGQNDFIGGMYGEEGPKEVLHHHNKQVCPFAFYSLVITANAKVAVCCVDWSLGTEVGDLSKESLTEVWHGEKLREFRRMQLERRRHENRSCRDCTFLHTSPDDLDGIEPAAFASLLGGK